MEPEQFRTVRLAVSALGWLVFFLTPSWLILFEAIGLGIRRPWSPNLVALNVLIGCGIATAIAPLNHWLKTGWFLATFPLFAIQILVLVLVSLAIDGLAGTQ